MLDQKKPPEQQPTGRPPNELMYALTPALCSELKLDLRYVLRDPKRAQGLPLLIALGQTVDREPGRIRFPAEALSKLASEIDIVADALPENSPLLDLSERARAFGRAAAFERGEAATGDSRGGVARSSASEEALPRSASEEAQLLKKAAAAMEVSFVTTAELDDTALAGYLNYCMTLEKYDAVISTLSPRAVEMPRVWIWNLLLAAMRLSKHADFTNTAARFHTWMESQHPEAINDAPDRVDARRFSTQKLRLLEQRELGIA